MPRSPWTERRKHACWSEYGLTPQQRHKTSEYWSRKWVSRMGIETTFGLYRIGGHPA